MKQKISPTSPKKRQNRSKEIQDVYDNPTLNHLERPQIKSVSLGSIFLFLLISIVGGALAAILVVLQGERIGIISTPQTDTTIIVRDGAKQYTEQEEFADAFIASTRTSLLRLYAQTVPSGDVPRDYVLSEGSFVGYGVLLTTDGKSMAPLTVLAGDTAYVAENWSGAVQEISNIVRDERSGLAFFSFPGNGFRAVDLLDSNETIPQTEALVLNYRPSDVQPSLIEHSIVEAPPVQLLNADAYIWSSEQFFRNLRLADQAEFPRGAPVLRSDGVLLGLFDGSRDNPTVLGVAPREAVMNDYLSGKDIVYPYLGASGIDVSFVHTIPTDLRFGRDAGLLLSSTSDGAIPAVVEGSPADQAGLQEGDLIVAVNGTGLSNYTSLGIALYTAQDEDEVTLSVLRDGEERTFSVSLETL